MGILSKIFGSGDGLSKNSKINNALEILQNSSASNSERSDALAKLKSIFLTSSAKDDLKIISQSISKTIANDKSTEIREDALRITDAIIENCL
ncbi:MAG TPA: hypothetical protein VK435_11925, partial [Thermodesulfovibrionales bacterium]|nr:hypothetical protein [Thermodesulfovibrionales bacterium]